MRRTLATDTDPRPDLLCTSVAQNVNPIYNLLPDILSSLSADADLPPEQFQVPIAACDAAL